MRDIAPLPGASILERSRLLAAAEVFGYSFALPKSSFYVNTTNLEDPTPNRSGFPQSGNDCPAVSLASLSCNANEAGVTDVGSFTLNSTSVQVPGIGTMIDAQTMENLSDAFGGATDYCTTNGSVNLGTIFRYGIANGVQFIEITPDLAADNTCYSYMASATTALQTPPSVNCKY